MIVKELLDLANMQDEYEIINAMTYEKNTYHDVNEIPERFNNMNVVRLYGYDAEGYDGLQIFVQNEVYKNE